MAATTTHFPQQKAPCGRMADGDRHVARLCAAVVLQTLPLAWRRTHTLWAAGLSLLGVAVETAGVQPYGGVYGFVGFLVLVHAVARWTSGAPRRAGVAILAGGVVIHTLSQSSDGPLGMLGNVFLIAVFGTAAWFIGHATRTAEQRDAQLATRNAEIVEQERRRISRELHDVVGHALAGISLTAGAAEQQPGAKDADMAAALTLIRTMSRDAASDVRRLVGLLREQTDDPSSTEPQPTLETVDSLVTRARDAGLVVDYEVTGSPSSIPGGLHLTAYRLIQEGLTNVAKHASAARTYVRVAWNPGRLDLEVTNTATAGRADPGPAGHGLVGLEERVGWYDGSLSAGATPDGGYRLAARFPIS